MEPSALNPDASRPQLGPFEEPAGFDLGEEFVPGVPRPFPDWIGRSRYIRARRGTVWGLAMVAAACWATHRLPFVQTLSFYLLPLGYLDWAGSGFAILAVTYQLRNSAFPGLLDYIRRGVPMVGRVCQVWTDYERAGEYVYGRHKAEVEFEDPVTSQTRRMVVSAPEKVPMWFSPKFLEPGVAAGDYVTLVALPRKLETSISLYGWLGLNPDHDVIRINGKSIQPTSPIDALKYGVLFTAIGWGMLAFLYSIGRYVPYEDENDWQPGALGIYGITICLAAIPICIWLIRRIERKEVTNYTLFKSYCFAIFCGVVGGFMIGFPTVGFINGYFDQSPEHFLPVRVIQLWNTTHEFVVRTYELEYQAFPKGEAKKKMVTVETLSRFQPGSMAVIDIGSGVLGIRWLREFYPIDWERVTIDQDRPRPGEIIFQLPNEIVPTRIVPVIRMREKADELLPEAMLPELRAQMVTYLTRDLNAQIIEPDKP